MTDALVGLGGIRPGHRVLDVATVIGEPVDGGALRRTEGTGGGDDLSPQMLAIAAERAHRAQVDNLELVEMDAEDPWLPRASFDALLCRFGLMFFADVPQALLRLGGLLVPGGRLAAAVWGPLANNPAIALTVTTVAARLGLAHGPVSPLGAEQGLEARMAAAGFGEVQCLRVPLRFEWASAEEFVAAQQAMNVPLRRLCAGHEPGRRAAAWAALTRAAGSLVKGDGRLRLSGEALVVVGRRSQSSQPRGRPRERSDGS